MKMRMKMFRDVKLMFVRNVQHTLRNPVFVFASMFQPLLYLLLFMPLLNNLEASQVYQLGRLLTCSSRAFWSCRRCLVLHSLGSRS
jgi:hypothetical protein